MEKIIDAIGGVEIDVSSEELVHLNNYISDLNNNAPDENYKKVYDKIVIETLKIYALIQITPDVISLTFSYSF